ncbi:8-oxo-dGTP diphosphatase MutT [Budviciaceae bacterium BWR-B9]|uniref:8-oxo-dGTP diphosphatase n=1 Tax=Limnobaculum allomyrinae TaxID=2791986 RepID=A0ABS1INH9_9GAMM|nr:MULTISPECIES: 8-oxo-dGTP diphosphatase MutT [Limnobaculum]MBK5143313.1 8-oxo-dGTP diphosphatase MutT [Limnobaculum allomyrinae]MBV7691201.1 8-oxo-dGTP diphosphatase MutT [Limnobaculum sp. M2-1]
MKRIEIAVGIIIDIKQAIFVTQRLKGSHLAGYWEFPGGKVESGEDAEQALRRELQEEVGIKMTHSSLLTTLEYDYPDRQLTLHFFIVDGWESQPEGREGQVSRWIDVSQLNVAEFPPANQPVIAELKQRYRTA